MHHHFHPKRKEIGSHITCMLPRAFLLDKKEKLDHVDTALHKIRQII